MLFSSFLVFSASLSLVFFFFIELIAFVHIHIDDCSSFFSLDACVCICVARKKRTTNRLLFCFDDMLNLIQFISFFLFCSPCDYLLVFIYFILIRLVSISSFFMFTVQELGSGCFRKIHIYSSIRMLLLVLIRQTIIRLTKNLFFIIIKPERWPKRKLIDWESAIFVCVCVCVVFKHPIRD